MNRDRSSLTKHRARDCRGTASVEAAVVLPVFVILFASCLYLCDQILARQAAQARARSCAWAYSMGNCNSVPAGCEDVVRPGREGAKVSAEVSNELGSIAPGIIKDAIQAVLDPILDAAFGRTLDARTEMSFRRPEIYGGGTGSSRGYYHLTCNLSRQEPIDVVKEIWNAVF